MELDILFAVFNKHLWNVVRDQSGLVAKSIPYFKNLLSVVEKENPRIVVFSPHLDQREGQPLSDIWKDMLYDLTMRDEPPQVIFMAGNEDKKGEIVQYALQCEVRDFVFNPQEQGDVTQHVFREIMDHIANPRSRKQAYEELGIVSRKQMPKMKMEQIEHLEQNRLQTEVSYDPFDDSSLGVSVVQVDEPTPPKPKVHRPHVIAVLSPASSGASTVAQNVATALAHENFVTALVDMDKKRSLHYMFKRDASNKSFVELFKEETLEGEQTKHSRLNVFTSMPSDEFYGDVKWLDIVTRLTHEVVVLDFSSGTGWRQEELLAAIDRCDEVLFVLDMDQTKIQQSRYMLDQLSQYSSIPIKIVLNKFIPEYLPTDLNELLPSFHSYEIGFHPEVYVATYQGASLVDLRPELRKQFLPFQRSVGS